MDIQILLDRLAVPARRAILKTGVTTLKARAQMSRENIAALHGIGKNALQLMETTLAENRLSLAEPE